MVDQLVLRKRSEAFNALDAAFPEPEYAQFRRYARTLLQGFDLEAFRRARAAGERPSEHAGLMRALVKEVNYWILPGAPGRVINILQGKNVVDMVNPASETNRHVTWGVYEDDAAGHRFKVGVFATQMGPSSCDITFGLDFLSNAPNRITAIRPGTAGTMHPLIGTGDVSIGSFFVGVDALCDTYAGRQVTFNASPAVMAALELAAARRLHPGVDALLDVPSQSSSLSKYHVGGEVTKGSLMWEIGLIPEFRAGQQVIAAYLEENGLRHSSMEGKTLAALLTIYERGELHPRMDAEPRVASFGTVNAIMNDHPSLGKTALFSDAYELQERGVTLACTIAEEAIRTVYLNENGLLHVSGMQESFERLRLERQRQSVREEPKVRAAEAFVRANYQVR